MCALTLLTLRFDDWDSLAIASVEETGRHASTHALHLLCCLACHCFFEYDSLSRSSWHALQTFILWWGVPSSLSRCVVQQRGTSGKTTAALFFFPADSLEPTWKYSGVVPLYLASTETVVRACPNAQCHRGRCLVLPRVASLPLVAVSPVSAARPS